MLKASFDRLCKHIIILSIRVHGTQYSCDVFPIFALGLLSCMASVGYVRSQNAPLSKSISSVLQVTSSLSDSRISNAIPRDDHIFSNVDSQSSYIGSELHLQTRVFYIQFTTITKQVVQLVLIMLVGTNDCVRLISVWEESGVPGENPPV